MPPDILLLDTIRKGLPCIQVRWQVHAHDTGMDREITKIPEYTDRNQGEQIMEKKPEVIHADPECTYSTPFPPC